MDHFNLGRYELVLEMAGEALDFVHTHQLSRYECGTRAVLAEALLKLGRIEASYQSVQAGQRLAIAVQDRELQCRLNMIEGCLLLHLEQWNGHEPKRLCS